MPEVKSYYVIDPEGKLTCRKCGVGLVKANAVFGYLDNAFRLSCLSAPNAASFTFRRSWPWAKC